MKAAQKKKLAEMLLPLLIKQGLKTSGLPYPAPVLVDDIKETEDFLERMGYEFIIGRRLQTNPRDTSKKIHLKMITDSPRIISEYTFLEENSVIWICLDADIALKALVLGGFPETDLPRRCPHQKGTPTMAFTTEANDLVRRLELQSESCHTNTPAELIPIREVNQEDLANTLWSNERAEHTDYYSLPLLNTDGTRVGGFGYISAIVDVYRDGTAIARTREWKYAYRDNEPTPDGRKPEVKREENHMVVRFYLLGCKHEYEERNDLYEGTLYSHDHHYVCKKCGHSYLVDSSG